MGTSSTPPLPSESVKEALEFARDVAATEIDRIERMHQRTLRYITWFVGVFAVLGSILGFFGWHSLRDAAVSEAQRQMKQRVDESVDKGLKDLNISKEIQDRVAAQSDPYIKSEVEREIRTGTTHDLIVSSARDAATKTAIATAEPIAKETADRKAAEAFEQRHLSPEQKTKLIAVLLSGRGHKVRVRSRDYTSEEMIYGDDFVEIFTKAGWQVADDLRTVHLPTSATFRGVAFDVPHKDHVSARLESIRKEFGEAGIPIGYIEGGFAQREDDKAKTETPYFVVGER